MSAPADVRHILSILWHWTVGLTDDSWVVTVCRGGTVGGREREARPLGCGWGLRHSAVSSDCLGARCRRVGDSIHACKQGDGLTSGTAVGSSACSALSSTSMPPRIDAITCHRHIHHLPPPQLPRTLRASGAVHAQDSPTTRPPVAPPPQVVRPCHTAPARTLTGTLALTRLWPRNPHLHVCCDACSQPCVGTLCVVSPLQRRS